MQRRLLSALAGVVMLLTPAAWAHEFGIGDLVIEHPWIRATPDAAEVAAGFMSITNTGGEADRLIAVVSPVAGTVQIHEMTVENDVMKMQELPEGLEIPAGATIELKPKSYHLMFMKLQEQLKEGDTVEAELVFQKAGAITILFVVEPADAQDHMQM